MRLRKFRQKWSWALFGPFLHCTFREAARHSIVVDDKEQYWSYVDLGCEKHLIVYFSNYVTEHTSENANLRIFLSHMQRKITKKKNK